MKQIQTTLAEFQVPDTSELEARVLAGIVCDSSLMSSAIRYINDDMFTSNESRNAWAVFNEMYNAHDTIDMTTVMGRIDKNYYTCRIIPASTAAGYSASVFEDHCVTLRDMTLRRKSYFHAIDILRSCADTSIPVGDLMSQAGSFQSYLTGTMVSKKTKNLADIFNELADDMENGSSTRIPTGFPLLDGLVYGGFTSGNLVILAARPSVGKTAVALYMAKRNAEAGKKPLFFSIEMTAKEVAQRYLFSTELVKPWEIAKRRPDWNNFEKAVAMFNSSNILINDSARSLDEIVTETTVRAQQGECDIAYVDYLGLIRYYGDKGMTKAQVVGEITHRLKQLAKDLSIPVVLLCQLNRLSAAEKRAPQLYDLRDSGDIEQDADVVLMLSEVDSAFDTTGITENCLNMYVRKNRGGKRDVFVKIGYNDTHSEYNEIDIYQG